MVYRVKTVSLDSSGRILFRSDGIIVMPVLEEVLEEATDLNLNLNDKIKVSHKRKRKKSGKKDIYERSYSLLYLTRLYKSLTGEGYPIYNAERDRLREQVEEDLWRPAKTRRY